MTKRKTTQPKIFHIWNVDSDPQSSEEIYASSVEDALDEWATDYFVGGDDMDMCVYYVTSDGPVMVIKSIVRKTTFIVQDRKK